jgi:iron-sulfur cluster assembly protein
MSYYMEYAEKIDPLDEMIEDKGVRILVDLKAVLFLLGTEMDYKIEKLSAQFTFRVPFLGSVNPSPFGDGMQ